MVLGFTFGRCAVDSAAGLCCGRLGRENEQGVDCSVRITGQSGMTSVVPLVHGCLVTLPAVEWCCQCVTMLGVATL